MSPPLIFIWLGEKIPNWAKYSLKLNRNLNKNPIYLLTDNDQQLNISGIKTFTIKTKYFEDSLRNSDYSFRDGFWLKTKLRFLYLIEFILDNNINSFFHAELDNICFNLDSEEMFNFKQESKGLFIPKLDHRACGSLIYGNSRESMISLKKAIEENLYSSINDMEILGSLLETSNKFHELPTIERCNNTNILFDPAPIGQYLFGIDPRNSKKPIFNMFINVTSKIDFSKLEFELNFEKGICKIRLDQEVYNLKNIHVHSKAFKKIIANHKKIINRINLHKKSFITHKFLYFLNEYK